MDFVLAIKEIKAKHGVTKTFYAMLCDYGAFDEEDGWVRNIVKQVCDNGYPLQMSKFNTSNNQWIIPVADMIYKLSNQYGYQHDKTSDVLHKLALGLGLITPSFDWNNEFAIQHQTKNSSTHNSATTSSFYCPYCGHAYYKPYSAFCAHCGKARV